MPSVTQENGQTVSNTGESVIPVSKILNNAPESTDELSKTLTDLLGAKEIKLAD